MDLYVSDIQHFSLGDGEGIRTTVFFKGCNLRCPWCHNPETISNQTLTLRFSNGTEKVCGRYMSVDEVLAETLADKDFYSESGGGVTLSGGEALLQADGAARLAEKLKQNGVSVIVDTAGSVPYENFQKLNPVTDEYYFDLKAADAEDYKKIVGGDFRLVTGNMRRLVEEGCKVRARIPLIPDFNDSREYSEKMCSALLETGVKKVDLLPFHRLGTAKYRALHKKYAYADTPPLPLEKAEKTAEIYAKYFIVKIEK